MSWTWVEIGFDEKNELALKRTGTVDDEIAASERSNIAIPDGFWVVGADQPDYFSGISKADGDSAAFEWFTILIYKKEA